MDPFTRLFIFFTAQEHFQAYKVSWEFSPNSPGDKGLVGAYFDYQKVYTPPKDAEMLTHLQITKDELKESKPRKI